MQFDATVLPLPLVANKGHALIYHTVNQGVSTKPKHTTRASKLDTTRCVKEGYVPAEGPVAKEILAAKAFVAGVEVVAARVGITVVGAIYWGEARARRALVDILAVASRRAAASYACVPRNAFTAFRTVALGTVLRASRILVVVAWDAGTVCSIRRSLGARGLVRASVTDEPSAVACLVGGVGNREGTVEALIAKAICCEYAAR